MSELKLKNCPFCDCEMSVRSNRDWHRPEGDHEDHCPIYDTDLMYPATDIGLSALVNCWNTRVTKPEATKPAQDLSAAILALCRDIPPHKFKSANDFNFYEAGFIEARSAAAALASPVDALVAGDSAQPEANADAKDAEQAEHEKSEVDWAMAEKIVDENAVHEALTAFSQDSTQDGAIYLVFAIVEAIRRQSIPTTDAAIQAQKDGHG